MSDPRLNSIHLDFPRRQQYRQARETALAARGWLTVAAEYAKAVAGDADDWQTLLPVHPDHLLPGPHFFLVEQQREGAYALRTGLNTVGRLTDNDIVLEDEWVSRRHCVLLVHAWGGCELHDTASRNGTFVNGRQIGQPVRLTSGDRIAVCRRSLLFVNAADCRSADGSADTADTACV